MEVADNANEENAMHPTTYAALRWIATVNSSIDLNKLEKKVLIGMIHELRAKARKALDYER